MNLTFNTEIAANISVVLEALNYYQNRQFNQAIQPLLNVLDVEPRNWDARLMLAACYYKTNQYAAAERAFRMICENSGDADLKKKAAEGLRAASAKLSRRSMTLPAEFGCSVERGAPEVSWLTQ